MEQFNIAPLRDKTMIYVIVCATLIGWLPGQIKAPFTNEFRVVERTEVEYKIPDGYTVLGEIDRYGEFHRGPIGPTGLWQIPRDINLPWGIPTAFNSQFYTRPIGGEVVYEFRSGMLVLGRLITGVEGSTFDSSIQARFVPSQGEPAISIDEFRHDEKTPRIYNLPGTFQPLPPGKHRIPYQLQLDLMDATADLKTLESRVASIVNGRAWPMFKTLKVTPDRRVGLLRGKQVYIGRLNDKGTFIEDRNIEPVPYINMPVVSSKNDKEVTDVPVINHPRSDREAVYEYRSNSLTPGRLNPDGEFVPIPGSIVTYYNTAFGGAFGSMMESPLDKKPQLRIYNLPGVIVEPMQEGK